MHNYEQIKTALRCVPIVLLPVPLIPFRIGLQWQFPFVNGFPANGFNAAISYHVVRDSCSCLLLCYTLSIVAVAVDSC